jgi:hypothetical protein
MEWVQKNRRSAAWNRCLPSTIYTHPTANLVPGNFNEHVGYTTALPVSVLQSDKW